MNEKLQNQLVSVVCKNLPRIAKTLEEISEHLYYHNYYFEKLLNRTAEDIITIHCMTREGIDRILNVGVSYLIEDWHGENKLCPDNDAVIMSAKIEDHELIGDELPVNANFQQLMEYFVRDEEEENEDN